MKRIVCEMCGGSDLVKQDGLFVCQSCGSKYSVEEARKMMVEFDGPVEVTGTVKVDDSGKFDRYKEMAINAYNSGAYPDAEKYFNAAMEINLDDWQCVLYKGLAGARQSTLANPRLNEAVGAAQIAYNLVQDNFDLRYEVAAELFSIAVDYHLLAWRHYKKFESVSGASHEYRQRLALSANVISVAIDIIALSDEEMKNERCRKGALDIVDSATKYLSKHNVAPFEYDSYANDVIKKGEKTVAYIEGYFVREARKEQEAARKNAIYEVGIRFLASDDISEIERGLASFQSIPNWKDSNDKARDCQEKISELLSKMDQRDIVYRESLKLFESYDVQQVYQALDKFQSIAGWKDADEKAQACQKWLDSKKADACKLLKISTLKNEEFVQFHKLKQDMQRTEKALEEAKEARKKGLKSMIIFVFFTLFGCLSGYLCMMKNQAEGWEFFSKGYIVFLFGFAAISVVISCAIFKNAPKTDSARASYKAAKDVMDAFGKKCREKK